LESDSCRETHQSYELRQQTDVAKFGITDSISFVAVRTEGEVGILDTKMLFITLLK
jgi:hypothetical protein